VVPRTETCKQSVLLKCRTPSQERRRTLNHWYGRLETYPLC